MPAGFDLTAGILGRGNLLAPYVGWKEHGAYIRYYKELGGIRGVLCIFVIHPSRPDYLPSPVALTKAVCIYPAQTPLLVDPLGRNEIELRWKRE